MVIRQSKADQEYQTAAAKWMKQRIALGEPPGVMIRWHEIDIAKWQAWKRYFQHLGCTLEIAGMERAERGIGNSTDKSMGNNVPWRMFPAETPEAFDPRYRADDYQRAGTRFGGKRPRLRARPARGPRPGGGQVGGDAPELRAGWDRRRGQRAPRGQAEEVRDAGRVARAIQREGPPVLRSLRMAQIMVRWALGWRSGR